MTFLKQAQQVGLITSAYSFFITSLVSSIKPIVSISNGPHLENDAILFYHLVAQYIYNCYLMVSPLGLAHDQS